MKVISDSTSIFASRPTGIVRFPKRTDNKFGYINHHNASGQLPVIQPVPTPDPEPAPPAETTPPPSSPVNGTPCPLGSGSGEYLNGVCVAKASTESQKDSDNSTQHIVAYGVGTLLGGGLGYLIAEKKNKNIYGGMLIGGGVVAGAVYLFFNGKEILDNIRNRGRVGGVPSTSNANGRSASSSKQKGRKCRRLNPDGTTTVYDCPNAEWK